MVSNEDLRWDAPENEAQNNFISWGQVGDFIYGTLIGTREIESTLPDRKGEKQKIYDIKINECKYHNLDEDKKPIKPVEEPQKGDFVSVGDRKTISSRMARVKIGQKVGLKFDEELPPKTKGYNPTKLVRVFTPKDTNGNYWMDEEWIETQKEDSDDIDW